MIHAENPFVDDPDSRDPVRRFRGRLASPVTIFTAGDDDERTGLTISSLNVIEGDPGTVEAVVGPSTDLWDAVAESKSFVVHVCTEQHRHLAEVFAGIRPSPGGVFAGLDVSQSQWGPVIAELGTRAFCSFEGRREVGYSGIVTGTIDQVEPADLASPLTYFRGRFRSLD